MKLVSGYPSLYLRGKTYVYRAVIPADLRTAFDCKSERKVSLRTSDLSDARVRWAKEDAVYQKELRLARGKTGENLTTLLLPTRSQGWSIVRDWHWRMWKKEEELLRRVPQEKY